jgi:Rhs element Vgr protein
MLGQPVLLELLTANVNMKWRPFHGYVTSARCVGANGGFARYTVTIEPWCAFLKLGRDSRMFQDKSVFQILDAVFGSFLGKGRLTPTWRYDIADRGIYPLRSLTCQYQESNFAFAERLMYEEGLFYYFEHNSADGEGSHTLVIADHNGAFQPNIQNEIRFTQPGAVMREDSLDRWRITTRSVVESSSVSSWDYRSRSSRPVEANVAMGGDAPGLRSCDTAGPYAYPTRSQGQRIANNHLQALQSAKEIHIGAGTVRTFAPGTTFFLRGHAYLDQAKDDQARAFAITRVVHLAHNNLSAELRAAITHALGEATASKFGDELREGAQDSAPIAERPLYRNRIDAIRSDTPYRSSGVDGHGTLLHPRPVVRGQQTAVVVGPPDSTIYTDRDHRIKIQFHWQRNSTGSDQSHSRLDHPSPGAHVGSPADDRACTWVRVASSLAAIAGANWGAVAIPRVGSEVLIDFLEGDIDRPIVIGVLYNGQGARDAQHNRVSHGAGAASGNAPAWFPGEGGAHAHPAALSGIKTQRMSSSQDGTGAYNQLVFDDSPAQSRIALQSHASQHAGTAEVNLGSLRHQTDNQRLQPVGFGAELKTAHSAALRAGEGLLLSTDARTDAGGNQLDSREAQDQNEQSHELQSSLSHTAIQHNAVLDGGSAESGPLPALAEMESTIDILKSVSSNGAQRSVTAYSQPHLQLSSPAGILMSTAADAVLAASRTTSITAGQDTNLLASGNSSHAVKEGISLFTYGKASAKDKPNQETGVRLHAASGKVSSQSHSGATRLTADKMVTVASINKNIRIAAPKHVLLTAQGAVLKLEGGNIMLHAPGKVDFKASAKELAGPVDGSVSKPDLPKAKDIYNEAFVVLNEETKQPMANVRYRLESASGVIVDGITDAQGRTQRVFTAKREELTLHLPVDE